MTSHAGALSSSLLQAWQERADPRAANASLSGFLRECAPESDSPVRIEHVRGRTGNHVHQLVNALIIAASAGRPGVALEGPGWNGSLFAFPRTIPAPPPSPDARCDVFLNVNDGEYDCRTVFNSFCAPSTVAARRRVYMASVRPYVRASVLAACAPPREDELVVHVRDGDVALDERGAHAQPPCAYFARVIRAGGWRRVHLVHSSEPPLSPCVAEIERTIGAADDKGGIAAHACRILTASNLALTSSSFGITHMMMNARVQRLYSIDTVTQQPGIKDAVLVKKVKDFELDADELCRVFPHVSAYRTAEGALQERNCSGGWWTRPA